MCKLCSPIENLWIPDHELDQEALRRLDELEAEQNVDSIIVDEEIKQAIANIEKRKKEIAAKRRAENE